MTCAENRIAGVAAAVMSLTLSASAVADQDTFAAYNTTFRKTYWSQLYPNSGFEFYCGERYDAPVDGRTPPSMSLEHAYAAQWMVEALQCGANRVECRAQTGDADRELPGREGIASPRCRRSHADDW